MDTSSVTLLAVTPYYAALLGLFFIAITLRVGFYRLESKIFLGDGGSEEMVRRMRSQANFVETAPLALILIIVMELSGASGTWIHGLAGLLLFGRICHFLGLSGLGPGNLRPVGMFSTVAVYLVSCIWLLIQAF